MKKERTAMAISQDAGAIESIHAGIVDLLKSARSAAALAEPRNFTRSLKLLRAPLRRSLGVRLAPTYSET